MVRYDVLGFKSLDDYFEEFVNTLLETNKTYSYFVNWHKVRRAVRSEIHNIALLGTLSRVKPENRPEYLRELLLRYPEAAKVLPIILAVRMKKNENLNLFDEEVERILTFKFHDAKWVERNADRIVLFAEKTGILRLFTDVKGLYDYLLGVEVGLDTHARKNRGGAIFERMVQSKVKRLLPDDYRIVPQDKRFSLLDRSKRFHDLVIYREEDAVCVIEVNFYNTAGSKPESIVGEYITLHSAAKEKGIIFVWITDGPAWKDMRSPLRRAMEEMDWVLNYRFSGVIAKILP